MLMIINFLSSRESEKEKEKRFIKNPASRQSQNLFQFRKVVFYFFAVANLKMINSTIMSISSAAERKRKEARKRKNGFKLIANWHSSAPTFLIFN